MSCATDPIMDSFPKLYCIKADSIGPPSHYLGADVALQVSDADIECWAMSSNAYHNALCSHKVRECVASGWLRVSLRFCRLLLVICSSLVSSIEDGD